MMNNDAVTPVVEELSRALGGVADALAAVDAVRMLEAEASLSRAMTALGALPRRPASAEARAAVEGARAALLRCRRLGASFSRAARLLTTAGGDAGSYDRVGSYVARPVLSPTLL